MPYLWGVAEYDKWSSAEITSWYEVWSPYSFSFFDCCGIITEFLMRSTDSWCDGVEIEGLGVEILNPSSSCRNSTGELNGSESGEVDGVASTLGGEDSELDVGVGTGVGITSLFNVDLSQSEDGDDTLSKIWRRESWGKIPWTPTSIIKDNPCLSLYFLVLKTFILFLSKKNTWISNPRFIHQRQRSIRFFRTF